MSLNPNYIAFHFSVETPNSNQVGTQFEVLLTDISDPGGNLIRRIGWF
ncbi:hypothetical protein [Cyclobacterium sp. SYSU L10401]|nr:hypothetical protein [Cyclobacterium sp. SYSU L10401]